MADKQFPLSIIIRTVDRATAGLATINTKLEAFTKPITGFRKEWKKLGENLGTKHVGEAFGHLKDTLASILEKLLLVVGAAGLLGEVIKGWVEHFADLGLAAKRLGISVDALAGLQYAAKEAGVPVEALSASLVTWDKNYEKLKLGTGRFAGFLEKASPALLEQFKHTKNAAEAFDLLANAIKQVKDPAQKVALATAAVGDQGADLVPMFAQGSKGIAEAKDEYLALAGSQEAAAGVSLKIHKAMIQVSAATDGLKAAIVTGLGPAILDLVKKLTEWLGANREKIAAWISDFATKLPAAIASIGSAISGIISFVSTIVDKLGGFKTIAIAVAAVLAGKLLYAIAAFGIALATNPIGQFIIALGLLATAVGLVVKYWTPISGFFSDLWLGIKQTFEDAWEFIKGIVDAIVGVVDKVKAAVGSVVDAVSGNAFIDKAKQLIENGRQNELLFAEASDRVSRVTAAAPAQAAIKVDFANMPRGARVTADPRSTADVDLSVGYQVGF